MVFTAFQARKLNPEEVNPMAGAVSKALEGFGQGMKAAYMPKNMQAELQKKQILNKYLPQMQEAEIFGKQFSPLAAIASNPMFLQNPQFQAALNRMIAQNPNMQIGHGEGNQGGQGNQNPSSDTFAGQTVKTFQDAQKLADKLDKAGKLKGYASSVGGATGKYLGDVGKKIIGLLPGDKTKELVDPALAQQQHQFDTFLEGLKQRAVQSQLMSPQQAQQEFMGHEDENNGQKLKRLQSRFPALFQEGQEGQDQEGGENTAMDVEEENNNDNRDLSFASDLSEQIKAKTGHEISPDLIFNYMKRVPGKINIPQLLKAAGVR